MQRADHPCAETSNRIRLTDKLVQLGANFKEALNVKPATLAVLVQILALVCVLCISWIAPVVLAEPYYFSDLQLVLMQAVTAMLLSIAMRMAAWWRYIHCCFPIALYFAASLHLSQEFYLVCFVLSATLFWTTFRSQVPFFPSFPVVWKQVADILPDTHSVRLIDIGSGLGDMPMYIAKVRPDSHIDGIEIAPLPWLISYLRAKCTQSAAIFKLGDYHHLDFANYDVVFAYLSPAAMVDLWDKAKLEMRPGSMLVSLEFDIPGVQPSMQLKANDRTPTLYVWQFN
jgi:hypothetical protein